MPRKLIALAALLCLLASQGSAPAHAATSGTLLGILQSELQRNFQVLHTQPVPAYFVGYTVHDQRTTYVAASNGALQRSDEERNRFATVDVRVGDYTLDNTHPIRGDNGRVDPRAGLVSLPLTDDETPIRQALWRLTDRTFKQATEALTRVKSNVASKIREEDPAPDFSREDPQTHADAPVNYTVDTAAWEGR